MYPRLAASSGVALDISSSCLYFPSAGVTATYVPTSCFVWSWRLSAGLPYARSLPTALHPPALFRTCVKNK